MVHNQRVWKGAMIVSLFFVLLSFNAAAWSSADMDAKMDSMKADMDATFAAKFGPTNNADDGNSGSVTVEQDAEVNGERSSQSWSSDDSDDNEVDRERETDGIKQRIKAKFAFHSTDTNDQDGSDDTTGDEQDSNDDSTSSRNTWDYDSDDTSNDDASDDSSDDSSNDDFGNEEPLNMEEETERILHQLINNERRQRGLQPFNWDSGLAETADYKSDDMAQRRYFAHTDPDGDNFRDIYDRFGYNCRIPYGGSIHLGGENIARTWFDRNVRTDTGSTVHYDTAEELADGLRRQWMTSDAHRRAILRPYYANHGLGVEITSDGRVYASEHFC